MKKAFVIGISGGSASGKTTFANNLKKALCNMDVFVIHMDSYFKPQEQRPYSEAPITGVMYVDNNHPLTIDLPKLERDLSDAAICGKYQVVIVEGLFTLWDKNIYNQLDMKLFVECRADERIVRRLKRYIEWGETLEVISNTYLDLVRYRHDEYVEPFKWRADLIINGSNSSDTALRLIVTYVKIDIVQRFY